MAEDSDRIAASNLTLAYFVAKQTDEIAEQAKSKKTSGVSDYSFRARADEGEIFRVYKSFLMKLKSSK